MSISYSYRVIRVWTIIRAAARQNQQNDMCGQQRLRLAWASSQSDQSFRCPHEESVSHWLPMECTAKSLIRLGGYPGWSESSLGAHSFCWFCHVVAHKRRNSHVAGLLLCVCERLNKDYASASSSQCTTENGYSVNRIVYNSRLVARVYPLCLVDSH